MGKVSMNNLFAGLQEKLLHNVFFLLHLKNTYEMNYWGMLVTTPLWLLSYPLLVGKTNF